MNSVKKMYSQTVYSRSTGTLSLHTHAGFLPALAYILPFTVITRNCVAGVSGCNESPTHGRAPAPTPHKPQAQLKPHSAAP